MKLVYLIFFILTFKSFSSDSLNIIFSKIVGTENYLKYCSYLKSINSKLKCINAYGTQINEVPKLFDNAYGLVLTGGPDVNPRYYGKPQDSSLCEVDDYRDSLEFKLLEYAFEYKIPIFAICRGEQILNVFLNGTLYPDIPTYFPSDVIHRCDKPNDKANCLHIVYISKESQLFKLLNEDSIIVNSFHHQGVEKLGTGLKAVAKSPEGLIEAYEWEDPNNNQFILAVQWHPERMENTNFVSKKLGEYFIEHVLKYKRAKTQKE